MKTTFTKVMVACLILFGPLGGLRAQSTILETEPNGTDATANAFVLNFSNDKAVSITSGATLAVGNDTDVYKVVLPAGYNYSIASKAYDRDYNSSIYSCDVAYSYRVDGASYNSKSDHQNDLTISGGKIVYFRVVPYSLGNTGNYEFEATVSRTHESFLSLSNTYYSLAGFPSTNQIQVKATNDWTASSNYSWISITNGSGTGDGTFSFTVDENQGSAYRYGSINVTSGITQQSIDIYQYQNEIKDSYEPNNTQDSATIMVLPAFVNDTARVKTSGATFHKNNDYDYYRINLPDGYNYSVKSIAQNSNNNTDGQSYTGYAYLNQKQSNGGYYDAFYYPTISKGKDSVYVYAQPGNIGTYAAEFFVQRYASDFIRANQSNYKILKTGATYQYLYFQSSVNWTVSSDVAWIKINTTSGNSGSTSLYFNVDTNKTTSARTGTITLSGSGAASVNITVDQDGDLLPDSYEVNNSFATAYTIPVSMVNNAFNFSTTGATIHIPSDVDCYKLTTPAGSQFTITTSINDYWNYSDSYYSFLGLLYGGTDTLNLNSSTNALNPITVPGNTTVYFKVKKYYEGYHYHDSGTYALNIQIKEVATPALSISASNSYSLGWRDTSFSFNVQSNVSYTVRTTGSYFTSVNYNNQKLSQKMTLYAYSNPTQNTRTDTITFSAKGLAPVKFMVTQAAGPVPTLSVSDTVVHVGAEAYSKVSIDVNSNYYWDANYYFDWIYSWDYTSFGNGKLTIGVNKNPYTYSRSGYLSVYNNVGASFQVRLVQAAGPVVLSLSKDSISFPTSVSVSKVALTSNTDWSLSKDQSWFTVTPTSGAGDNDTLVVTTSQNATSSVRSGLITFKCGTSTYTLPVYQATTATPTLSTSVDTIKVKGNAQGTASFTISSNQFWSIEETSDWLSLNANSGSNNGTVTITTSMSYLGVPRKTNLTIHVDGMDDVIVTVVQSENPILSLSGKKVFVDAAANSEATFSVNANFNWTAVADSSWVSLSLVSGTRNENITLTLDENTTGYARKAHVTVSSDTLTEVLDVIQRSASPSLLLDEDTVGVKGTIADTTVFHINSNTAWEVAPTSSWITVNKVYGLNKDSIEISTTPNPYYAIRFGEVVVSADGVPSQILKVKQNIGNPVLTVSSNSVTLYGTYSSTVNITSNLGWSAISDQSWLTISSTSGNGNGSITLTADKNTAVRTGTVTIKGGGITQVVNVTQELSTGVDEVKPEAIYSVYPNPNSGQFTLVLNSQEAGNVVLSLIDLSGHVLSTQSIYKSSGVLTQQINTNVPNGSYFLEIRGKESVSVKRILIVK